MSHTPGPWKYSLNVGPTKALIVEADGSTIVEIRLHTYDRRFESNARLIAAAPELLDALKALCDAVDNGKEKNIWPAMDKARAAIAKATTP